MTSTRVSRRNGRTIKDPTEIPPYDSVVMVRVVLISGGVLNWVHMIAVGRRSLGQLYF